MPSHSLSHSLSRVLSVSGTLRVTGSSCGSSSSSSAGLRRRMGARGCCLALSGGGGAALSANGRGSSVRRICSAVAGTRHGAHGGATTAGRGCARTAVTVRRSSSGGGCEGACGALGLRDGGARAYQPVRGTTMMSPTGTATVPSSLVPISCFWSTVAVTIGVPRPVVL